MLNYHPSIELLTDFSAGSLSLAHALIMATHLEHCPECRRQVQKLELIGSQLFEHQNLANVPNDNIEQLKQSLLSKISEQNTSVARQSPPPKATATSNITSLYGVPKSLRQFIPESYESLHWIRLSPSFRTAILCNENGSQVAFTRIRAGSYMPSHAHTGDEITLVLEGSFSDETGIYRRGDFIYRNHNHKHKPRVTTAAECICLTVLDAPIQFTGFFTRWLNPVLRRIHPHTA